MNKTAVSISSFCLSLLFTLQVFAQLQSPNEFLGYELGERWTLHHQVLSYVKHVAEESEYVTIHSYGTTNQHRELVYLIVSSPENHANIEEIRQNNLRLTGLVSGEPTANKKGIVWLSYNIHGNETSSSEAMMRTLHELVRPDNPGPKNWLENTVVIIDPMVNPDGRDRYVNWFNQMLGAEPNPDIRAREHHEPWPGGRSNHYLFDLNRDWAWQIQQESKYRYKIYREWFPHIHVDYHEQGYDAPYYFAPAAEPFHKAITDWQREFQTMIGENHISYFDKENWLYFTRERFDLFYPSYGDTWPTFHGSIGMTYEMPGHSLAGLTINMPEGGVLTLSQRLLQHHVTGMSTIETASRNSERMISEFQKFFDDARNNPSGQYKTFVVKADNNQDNIYHLLRYLDTKQVRYGTSGSARNANGFNYSTGETDRVSISPDDILISVYQPQGNLVRVFFEPNPELADSLTYDITAWEAHYRYGLDGYALETRINPDYNISAEDFRIAQFTGSDSPYAYLLRWESMDDARFLAHITKEGVNTRFTQVPFEIDGTAFGRGSLVIPRRTNSHLDGRFDDIIREAAEKHRRSLHGATSGFVTTGSDFGSANLRFIAHPKVAILLGQGTSSLNAGEIWHYFDKQLGYPATLIHSHQIMSADINPFNVLVLPSGSYNNILTDTAIEKISAWARDGGTLIVFGETNSLLAGRDGFLLERKIQDSSAEEPSFDEQLQPHGDSERRSASSRTPGSIYKVTMDYTHPLAFGYGEHYFSLKSNASAYNYLDEGVNVGTSRGDAHVSGFAGYRAKQQLENTLNFGVQPLGTGQVVFFADNPLFRGFWENGKLLMANAVFMVRTRRDEL
ncbi:MAG: zinc carboxypeptidase [Balneolaceae bacterium]|nr:MAG: zinc carboxypeptidase [Balneolaceae bacterium]